MSGNWNHTSASVFSCKFAAYFGNTFAQEQLWRAAYDGIYQTRLPLPNCKFLNFLTKFSTTNIIKQTSFLLGDLFKMLWISTGLNCSSAILDDRLRPAGVLTSCSLLTSGSIDPEDVRNNFRFLFSEDDGSFNGTKINEWIINPFQSNVTLKRKSIDWFLYEMQD